MESKKIFGDYIKEKRTDAGLTQKEFAARLYVTESAISKWERGLSYPDITLITVICEILGVSERELLTASEDVKIRKEQKLAKRYQNLVRNIKIIQCILFGFILFLCFIIEFAVFDTLSLFFIIFAIELMAASLTLFPLFFEKNRASITFCGFIATFIFLLLMCSVYAHDNWFGTAFSIVFCLSLLLLPFVLFNIEYSMERPLPLFRHKTLVYMLTNTVFLFFILLHYNFYAGGGGFLFMVSIAVFFLILPWTCTMIIRYSKIDNFFKAAICFFLTAILCYIVQGFLDMMAGKSFSFLFTADFNNWTYEWKRNIIVLVAFFTMLLSAVFLALGILLYQRKKKATKSNKFD